MNFIVNNGDSEISVPIYYILLELNTVEHEKVTSNISTDSAVISLPEVYVYELVKVIKYFNIKSLVEVFTAKGLLGDDVIALNLETLKCSLEHANLVRLFVSKRMLVMSRR